MTTARIEVIAAGPDQEPILANLLELYIHDFSEFLDIQLGPDGRFGYPHLLSIARAGPASVSRKDRGKLAASL